MIDTEKIRTKFSHLYKPDATIWKLCDEVDRVVKLHMEAANAYAAAEGQVFLLQKKIGWLGKCCAKQEKYVVSLLDALVLKGEKR